MLKKMIAAVIIFTAFGNAAIAQSAKAPSDTIITIKVKGVTCSADLKTLSGNVMELKGVSNCQPGKVGPTSTFKISYNTALVSTKEIFQAIENTGGCHDPNEKPYKVKQ